MHSSLFKTFLMLICLTTLSLPAHASQEESSQEATATPAIASDTDSDSVATALPSENALPTEVYPYIQASVTLNKSANYQVGDSFSYTIDIQNDGLAPAENYQVQFPISQMSALLANDLQAGENASDVQGQPYVTWTNHVASLGENSSSQLSAADTSGLDLNDVITLARGESIQYSVSVTVSSVSIDVIPEITVTVLDEEGESADFASADSLPIEGLSTSISRTKSTNASEYTPGGEVEYIINVKNNHSSRFANNIQVFDNMTCIQTEQVDGSTAPAFSQWKLDVVSKVGEDEGTDAGSFNYGVFGTQDINLYPDLAPAGEVTYKLTVQVADTSIGKILDNGSCQDNISEGGTGIKMPDGNLYVKKEVSSHYYSAGHNLTYTITVTNSGDGYALDVPVVDKLSEITTTNVHGETVQAYLNWTITAQGYDDQGNESDLSNTGLTTAINNPTDLDVLADISPNQTVIYTIEAQTFPTANAEIRNTVTVDGSLVADVGSIPYDYDVSIQKRVNDTQQNSYTRGDNEMVYTITLTNAEGNGFASNVTLEDEISAIEAELLGSSDTAPVFKSWTIESEIKLLDPSDVILRAFTEVGDFPSGYSGTGDRTAGDIKIGLDGNAAAQIPAGVQIVYTITAQIDREDDAFADSPIIWGEFTNQATVASAGSAYSAPFSHNSDVVETNPNIAKLVLIKTAEVPHFTPGEEVVFHIEIRNRGWGYANNVQIKDAISELNFFDSWTISAETDSLGGTTTGNFSDNQDLDTTIDIAPARGDIANGEEYGFVIYHVTGIVKSDYALDEVSNTASVRDPATGLESKSSAEISRDDVVDKFNVSIVKVSSVYYTPGEDKEYIIYLQNNGDQTADNLTFLDTMNLIKNPLANDKDGHYEDIADQNPFESWSVNYNYIDNPSNFSSYNTDEVTTQLSLEPTEIREIHIRARVKDNALDKITNTAYIYQDRGLASEENHLATDESLRTNPQGDIYRYVDKSFYSPGDTLTYKVEITSNIGYFNNVQIQEAINDLEVELLDGSMGNPFYNKTSGQNEFTVSVAKEDSHQGGTTDGTLDGIVADNQNIDTNIDVGPDDKVTFTVTGKIRLDAMGEIDFSSINSGSSSNSGNDNTLVKPYSYQIKFSKNTTETNYTPGDILTYNIVVENVGQGNAQDISVLDEISKIMVDTTTGSNIAAFESGWTIDAVPSGAYPDYVDAGSFTTGGDINTQVDIPLQTTLTYVVKAKVVDSANSEIVNQLKVNGDTVSTKTKPFSERNQYSMAITNMQVINSSGDTVDVTNFNRYMPGGTVEYTIRAENLNNVNAVDIPIFNHLSEIETDYFDGTTGPAFESWEITTNSDTSSITQVGSVNNNADIETDLTLASNSLVSEGNAFVEYIVTAHISEKAVGSIANSACFEADCGEAGNFKVSATTIKMLNSGTTMTKQAYEAGVDVDANGDLINATAKSTYSHLNDDSDFSYVISLKNTGRGTEYGQSLQDSIGDIMAKIAENSGNGSNPTETPFSATPTVRVVASQDIAHDAGNTAITTPTTYTDADIDTPITIAPYGWLHFIVEGNIDLDTLGDFTNTASYAGTNQSAKLTPVASSLAVNKTITNLGGQAYNSSMTYLPGQEVVYSIVIENNSDSWANDVKISDNLSNVKVEVMGGNTQTAFSTTQITHTTGTPMTGTETYVPSYTATDSNLNIEVDIAPRDTLTFTITATIREDAVGEIDANSVTVGSDTATTDIISPTPANVSASMELISTSIDSACTTSVGCEYEVFGEVVYAITVTNAADSGIANDIKLVDAINSIQGSSTNKPAFSAYRTELNTAPTDNSNYSLTGKYQGGVALNANIDLKADNTLVFYVTGTVAGDLEYIDGISNTATLNGANINDTIVLKPIPIGETPAFAATKTTDTPTYTPNGEVLYFIDLYNSGNTNITVGLEDIISSFEVETADGSMKPALSAWTVEAEIKIDGNDQFTNVDEINSLGSNADITEVNAYLGSTASNTEGTVATHVRITITGTVRADAIGTFTNEFTATDTATNNTRTIKLAQGYITPESGSLSVTKVATRDPATYSTIAGDDKNTISFDVTVTNAAGGGYAVNTQILDPIQTILTQLADEEEDGLALVGHWVVTTPEFISHSGASINTKQVGTSTNDENGYSGVFNIAPDESVTLNFSATVEAQAIGEITNIVTASSDLSGNAEAQASYLPEAAQLALTKTVDKTVYSVAEEGDVLTYTVILQNNGGGWANNLRIVDEFSKVRTDIAGDIQGTAFDESTITASGFVSKITGSDPIYTQLPAVTVGEPELVFSLAPNEQAEFELQARLNNNVLGSVTNTVVVTYQGDQISADATSTPETATLTINKAVVDESGAEIANPTYFPGDYVRFAITVENTSNSFANSVQIEDALSSIMVTNNLGESESALTEWSAEVEASDPRSTIANFDGSVNTDLNYSFDLAPNSTGTFTIIAKVSGDAVTDISNKASLTLEDGSKVDSNTVTIVPEEASYTATKKSIESEYEPGKSLGFQIIITNTSDAFINDYVVTDDMTDIEIEYLDGSTGPAFKPETIEFSMIYKPANAVVEQVNDSTYKLDLPPNRNIIFEVRGEVVDQAIGDITNIMKVNDGDTELSFSSNTVTSVPSLITAELVTDAVNYTPGKQVEYRFTIKNIGAGSAQNVYVEADIQSAMGTIIDGTEDTAFTDWEITVTEVGVLTSTGTISNGENIIGTLDLAKGGSVTYTILTTTNENLVSPIDMIGYYVDLDDDLTRSENLRISSKGSLLDNAYANQVGKVGNYQLPPITAELALTKTADKNAYENEDTQLIYSLSVENPSGANAADVDLSDAISALQGASGHSVFTTWTVEGKEYEDNTLVDSNVFNQTDEDLSLIVDLKNNSRNRFEFTITGQINKGLNDDITNTFVATLSDGTQFSADNTVHIKRIPDNTGELNVTKVAFKDEVQMGDVVEYEVIVSNPTESDFVGATLEDRLPGSFQYVANSSQVVRPGADGIFDNADDIAINVEPSGNRTLKYNGLDLLAGDTIRLRYLLRVNIGATFNSYVNTAYVTVNNVVKSNYAKATVKVMPDKLFDTASIIGKVFEDRNGDGYQADATAKGVVVTANIPASQVQSAVMHQGGKSYNAKDVSKVNVGSLAGISRNRSLNKSSKAVIEWRTSSRVPFDIQIASNAGTRIKISADGQISTSHIGDRTKGLTAENLDVTRKLFKVKGQDEQYVWRVIIENKGLYEEGIPGVRLLTVEGIVIETDQYGRYHVPDQWVTDKKGKNFLVKVDTDTLPTGMKVISENPKVLRISANALAKFNFSVQQLEGHQASTNQPQNKEK